VNRRAAVVVAVVAVAAWISSGELALAPRLWTVFLLAALPALMLLQAQQLRDMEPLPRIPAYVSSIAALWALLGVTLAAAFLGGMQPPDLGLIHTPVTALLFWSGAATAAGLLLVFAFHGAGFRESAVTRQLVPASPAERWLFLAVSATAGICEEIIFRGFLLSTLDTATGSTGAALLLSSAAFGLVHAYQQPAGALRAAMLGALLAVPVLLTGSVYPAIIAHTLIDIGAGLLLARYLIR
jgi:membrane protease YdiL (CAAX protease family)